MSIYASLQGIDGALTYQGSHVLPSEYDDDGAAVGLALIPSHITRDGRDDQPEDEAPWPWLRVTVATGVGEIADAVITPKQARRLAAELTEWADQAEGKP